MGVKVIRKITPVILAGMGEPRLRSLMGKNTPRSFYKFLSQKSLFQKNVLQSLSVANPVIVCDERYVSVAREQLREIGVRPRAIITEPEHCGSISSVAMAAFHLKNKNEVMMVLRADCSVFDDGGEVCFSDFGDRCSSYIDDGVVFFGSDLGQDHSKCGIIRYSAFDCDSIIHKVDEIILRNKVDKRNGHYLYNTGCFMVRPKVFLDYYKGLSSGDFKLAERSYYSAKERDNVLFPATEDFLQIRVGEIDCVTMFDALKTYVYVLQSETERKIFPKIVKRCVNFSIKKA